jgi:geranylgeranyl reductase family protein
MTISATADILVVGGGPAGAAAAYWAAVAGHDVMVLEQDLMPRARPCGDTLTPRAVGHLYAMGLRDTLRTAHRHVGLRMSAHGRSMELPWPDDSGQPEHSLAIRRPRLDDLLLRHAASAGARVWTDTVVHDPIIDNGHLRGCRATGRGRSGGPEGPLEVRARYVVIADGPLSAFGRALGTARSRTVAQGIGMRGYYRCLHHDEPWLEVAFDLRDNAGAQLPGYGWVFPLGDGSVNVGVGLLSHHQGKEALAPGELLDQWVRQIPDRWGIDAGDLLEPPAGGRLPMGGSVRPRSGPNWVVVGDAAGSVNPFNGDGIGPALANGRLAAAVLGDAIEQDDGLALRRYETELEQHDDPAYRLGRLATKALGKPGPMRRATRIGMRSRALTGFTMRVSSSLLRADGTGIANRVDRAARRVAGWLPED